MGGKYTPGPWMVCPRGTFKTVAVARGVEGGFVVSGTNPEQEDADAHLIAAAPDLLEVLEDLVEDFEERNPRYSTWTPVEKILIARAKESISKARGAA